MSWFPVAALAGRNTMGVTDIEKIWGGQSAPSFLLFYNKKIGIPILEYTYLSNLLSHGGRDTDQLLRLS